MKSRSVGSWDVRVLSPGHSSVHVVHTPLCISPAAVLLCIHHHLTPPTLTHSRRLHTSSFFIDWLRGSHRTLLSATATARDVRSAFSLSSGYSLSLSLVSPTRHRQSFLLQSCPAPAPLPAPLPSPTPLTPPLAPSVPRVTSHSSRASASTACAPAVADSAMDAADTDRSGHATYAPTATRQTCSYIPTSTQQSASDNSNSSSSSSSSGSSRSSSNSYCRSSSASSRSSSGNKSTPVSWTSPRRWATSTTPRPTTMLASSATRPWIAPSRRPHPLWSRHLHHQWTSPYWPRSSGRRSAQQCGPRHRRGLHCLPDRPSRHQQQPHQQQRQ